VSGLRLRTALWLARGCSSVPILERGLLRLCRDERLRRWSRAGAVAVAYPQVLQAERLEVAELEGFRLSVNLAEHQGAGAYFFGQTVVPAWVGHWVRAGDTCLDVGANAGVFSLAMAHAAGAAGRVVAFEPNPALVRRFCDSLALNPGLAPRIELDERAVSDEDGARVRFFPSLDPHNSGTSSLLAGAHGTRADHALEVQTVTLRAVLERRGLPRIRLAKVDVEGVEDRVVRGMGEALAAHRVEAWFVEMKRGAEPEGALLSAGYRGWAAEGDALAPLGSVAPGSFGDFVFVAPHVEAEFHRVAGLG
jgi:FkbM family methyltransferase